MTPLVRHDDTFEMAIALAKCTGTCMNPKTRLGDVYTQWVAAATNVPWWRQRMVWHDMLRCPAVSQYQRVELFWGQVAGEIPTAADVASMQKIDGVINVLMSGEVNLVESRSKQAADELRNASRLATTPWSDPEHDVLGDFRAYGVRFGTEEAR